MVLPTRPRARRRSLPVAEFEDEDELVAGRQRL
jgi:hypothetical protein